MKMIARRTTLAVSPLGAFGFLSDARAQTSPLGAALLQIEDAVTWDAVSTEWRDIRPRWLQQVAAAKSPGELAALMAALETSLGWHAVEQSWRGRRDSWTAEAQRIAGGR